MALTFPLPLAALNDLLPIASIRWSMRRNDEFSGTGSGQTWSTEIGPAVWQAEVKLDTRNIPNMKPVEARLRALRGSQNQFFLVDPTSPYPAADPDGALLGSSVVTLSAIGTGRSVISLSGLPAGYRITAGDKFSFTYSASPTRYFFGEFAEDGTATAGGVLASISITPQLPDPPFVAGVAITLKRPFLKAQIDHDTLSPGWAEQRIRLTGATFTALQKI